MRSAPVFGVAPPLVMMPVPLELVGVWLLSVGVGVVVVNDVHHVVRAGNGRHGFAVTFMTTDITALRRPDLCSRDAARREFVESRVSRDAWRRRADCSRHGTLSALAVKRVHRYDACLCLSTGNRTSG